MSTTAILRCAIPALVLSASLASQRTILISPSVPVPGDHFGEAVAIDGDRLFILASNLSATGIGPGSS